MQIIKVLLIVLLLIIISPIKTYAQETNSPGRVVIINQVRGSECCDQGSFEHLEQQINTLQTLDLSAAFVIRYDALQDEKYQELLTSLNPEQFELGLFLEITPQLALDASVEYHGNNENWYQAQHAYTVGYSREDRKKLLDTQVQQFEDSFGYMPPLTTAWIIDTASVNYLRNEYGIEVHQITREQWGTDSYTLYGGPPHYPYIGSNNWSFIPAATTNGTLMLRQTGADPLYNYGDQSNAFTTQPNDYTLDGKDFSYFQTLFDNFMNQPGQPYGFVLLGLENSMPQDMQEEYSRQLEYVAQNEAESAVIQVVTPTQFNQEFREQWQANKIQIIKRESTTENTEHTAFWISTSSYRVRLLIDENQVFITDVRLYSNELTDPYSTTQAENLAYWVTPFIFDSSRFYVEPKFISTGNKVSYWLKTKLFPDYQYTNEFFPEVKNDSKIVPSGLHLPSMTGNIEINRENPKLLSVTYPSNNNKITIEFTPEVFRLKGQNIRNQYEVVLPPNLPVIQNKEVATGNSIGWMDESTNENHYSLLLECQTDICTVTPKFNDTFNAAEFYSKFYPYVLPEITSTHQMENDISYVHNQVAINNTNPVRAIVKPLDSFGYPTAVSDNLEVRVNPPVDEVVINEQDGSAGIVFVDFISSKPGKHQVQILNDEKILLTDNIHFVPNCSTKYTECLRKPADMLGFTKLYITGKLRQWLD